MTRNAENAMVQRIGLGGFLGLWRGGDPADCPQGQLFDGQNMVCEPGEIRVRDGLTPVYRGILPEAQKLMAGARGRLWSPPWIVPPSEQVFGEAFTLQLGYAPREDLYVNADHATQTVAFTLYGSAAAGLSGNITWDFGDGGSSVGTSTTVSHGYTKAGTFTVTASGTGTGTKTYTAQTTITITTKPTAAIPGTGTTGGTLLPPEIDLKVNGSDGPVDLAEAGNVTVTWTSRNATSVYVNGAKKSASGSMTLAVGSSGTTVTAEASATGWPPVTDTVAVTVSGTGTEPSLTALPRTLRVSAPSFALAGTAIAAAYETLAALTPGAAPSTVTTTCTIEAWQEASAEVTTDGAGGYYGEELDLVSASSIANSDAITPVLASGLEVSAMTLRARIVETGAQASAVVLVYRDATDIEVDVYGDATSREEYQDPNGVGGYVGLIVSAKIAGTSQLDTGFDQAVRLIATLDDYAGANNDALSLEWVECGNGATPIVGAGDPLQNGDEIPGDLFEDGQAWAIARVRLPNPRPAGPDFGSYQDIDFTGEVVR